MGLGRHLSTGAIVGGLLLVAGAALAVALPGFFEETFIAVREAPLQHRDRRESLPLPSTRVRSVWQVAMAAPFGTLRVSVAVLAALESHSAEHRLPTMPAVFLADIPRPPARPLLMPTAAAYASNMPTSGLLTAFTHTLMASSAQQGSASQPERGLGEALLADTAPAKPGVKVAMLGAMPSAGLAIGRLAEATRLSTIVRGACSVPEPYRVTALGPNGRTQMEPAATLDPAVMDRLGLYEGDVQASAKSILGEPIRAFRVAASYDCRTMNHRSRAHLSEHARGNAVDIAGFQTASGEWITVKADFHAGGKKEAFLKSVHQETCDRFQVVLGPGSDGMHEDHFHMDLGNWKRCR